MNEGENGTLFAEMMREDLPQVNGILLTMNVLWPIELLMTNWNKMFMPRTSMSNF